MNRTGLRALAVGATLFIYGAVQAGVQTASPTPPKQPGPPRTARPGSISTVVTVDKIVSEALASVNQSDGKTPGMTGRSSIVMNSRVLNGLPEKRQDINLVDVPLKDAIKRVLEDSKTPYVIDDDVPNEPKVSIKLTNAPLTTILDALTLSNHIGWRTEFKRSTSATETAKPSAKDDKQSNNGAVAGDYFYSAASSRFVPQIHVGKTVAALPSSFQYRTLDIDGPPSIASQNILRGTVAPQTPQLRIYRWQSQKRSFTCPRCHNTISILHQPEEVKCTKCQRAFEDSWKVCPFDGTKRPEPKNKWRFCPICGKSITLEASWSVPSNFVDYYRLDVPTAAEIEQVYAEAARTFPSLADEGDGHDHYREGDLVPAEPVTELLTPFAPPPPEVLIAP